MYILSGVMSFISEYYPDNGTISVMVSNYGDNYKNAPDGATIKKFMEQVGDEIFNAAARNVLFKTTVADKNLVDWENIAPAPSAVTDNPDGSAEIAWSFDAIDVDKIQNIQIPVRSDRFAESGYARLTSNTALYYNDKEGKGQKTYCEPME